jgi:hypothetical protein
MTIFYCHFFTKIRKGCRVAIRRHTYHRSNWSSTFTHNPGDTTPSVNVHKILLQIITGDNRYFDVERLSVTNNRHKAVTILQITAGYYQYILWFTKPNAAMKCNYNGTEPTCLYQILVVRQEQAIALDLCVKALEGVQPSAFPSFSSTIDHIAKMG